MAPCLCVGGGPLKRAVAATMPQRERGCSRFPQVGPEHEDLLL